MKNIENFGVICVGWMSVSKNNMNEPLVMKIGKYTVECVALNEPSEEAIMRTRKTINRIMNEYYKRNVENESKEQ